MMKKPTLSIVILALTAVASVPGILRAHGNAQSDAKATIEGAHVTIHYGRPLLKGRDPLKLIDPGQIWRMGADVSTTIESDSDLEFGGTRVLKGKHILLVRLTEPGKWTLIVSREPVFKYEPSAKIAEVPMQLEEGRKLVQELTISLVSQQGHGVIQMAWGTSRLVGSFTRAK